MSIGNFLQTFQDNLSVPSSGVRDSWPLEMEPVGCPETSVRNYQYSLCKNPEARNSQPGKYLEKLGKTMQHSVRIAG